MQFVPLQLNMGTLIIELKRDFGKEIAMTVKQITVKDLEEKLKQAKLTIIDFSADWCGPCKQLSPILDDISASLGDVCEIYKVDVDNEEYRDFTTRFMIMSIPTVLFFKNGKMVHHFIGLYDKETIKEMINKHK